MNQSSAEGPPAEALPAPVVQHGNRFTIIWLIPLIAAIIGAGLVIKTFRETGPTITIVFKSAEGLVAGKTEIKYKDVSVGKVQAIQLSEDLSQVMVTAEMRPEVANHLTRNAQFWVVRARVAVGEVTGINTLFSGAYIGMVPGDGGKTMHRFEGLENPPAVPRDLPGRQFHLRAEKLGSLDIGSPVYYRQVKVGRVTKVNMAEDGTAVLLEIFVESPFDEQVRRTTRFYNASGLNMTIGADGVRIDTPSLASLLVGGISFFGSGDTRSAPPVTAGQVFTLYDNRESANAAAYSYREYYLLYFDETVRGLSAGAPVDFHGIKIGQVVSIRLLFDQDRLNFRIPVLIAIEPDRFEFTGETAIPEYKVMEELVQKGLRAQQRTGNLLTGQSYISMSIYPDAEPRKIINDDIYPVLPTIPNTVGEITATVKRLLERFQQLPLEETLADIREAARQVKAMTGSKTLESAIDNIDKSFAEFRRVTTGLNNNTLSKLDDVLEKARDALAKGEETLSAASAVIAEGSPAVYNLNLLLLQLQDAARAVEALADYLERHPDAIVFGKGEQR